MNKTIHWEELPDVLTAQNISDILGISRRRVYELFQLSPDEGGIPNYEIGISKRADKADVLAWKESLKTKKIVSTKMK
ncbi:DNA-binding protein [Paenibacillus rhizosphaerae]|uniref:DNA-binding protein n=1 Tax=Paenibacillus rhizosphaerae TaxID=297318 RepID=A0A1R1ES40_9BACL|nr:helix-turn-helix domain-containing protein [Paenibacillus rhizosphaerae]OMF54664.1 DNA-binding protein [Paenibacillus rhizosphaerae]